MANICPKKVKHAKVQKGRNRGNAKGGSTLAFGDYGLQALTRGPITAAQIEAARVAINRFLKRKGKMWMRIFPHKPVTKKPAETRMGRGKGPVEYWVAQVKPNVILFEIAGVTATLAREAMRLADTKLPIQCRFLNREELEKY